MLKASLNCKRKFPYGAHLVFGVSRLFVRVSKRFITVARYPEFGFAYIIKAK